MHETRRGESFQRLDELHRNNFSLLVQFFTLLKNFSHRKQNVIYYLFIFLMCEEAKKNERQKFRAALDDAFVMRCGNALGVEKVPVGVFRVRRALM
jgi:hypothetical protein